MSQEDNGTPPPIGFTPINDNVLVKMDVQEASFLVQHLDDRPTVVPSGVVVAIGRGVFIPGTGFVETQVKPGDHVAISTEGLWVNLPLSEDKNEIFVCVSESIILGKLEGATRDRRWFKKQESDRPATHLLRR